MGNYPEDTERELRGLITAVDAVVGPAPGSDEAERRDPDYVEQPGDAELDAPLPLVGIERRVVVLATALQHIARIDCLCDGADPGCTGAPHIACEALGIPWPHPHGNQRRIVQRGEHQ